MECYWLKPGSIAGSLAPPARAQEPRRLAKYLRRRQLAERTDRAKQALRVERYRQSTSTRDRYGTYRWYCLYELRGAESGISFAKCRGASRPMLVRAERSILGSRCSQRGSCQFRLRSSGWETLSRELSDLFSIAFHEGRRSGGR
jgi:hypothetical protein